MSAKLTRPSKLLIRLLTIHFLFKLLRSLALPLFSLILRPSTSTISPI
jgi:hypothetical protein